MNLHALAEPGQGAWFFLVASLSKPALDAPNIPVQLLGEPFQSLLIRMLWNKAPEKTFLSIFFFYLHHLQVLGYIWLNFPSNFYCRHFNIYDWESSPSIWSMNKDNTYITHYETRQKNKNLAPMLAYFLISKDFLWSNQQLREEEPASWLSQSHQTSREEFTETSTHTSPSQRKKRKYIFTL